MQHQGKRAGVVLAGCGVYDGAEIHDIVADERNKLVSTPAYMLAQSISEVAIGVEKLVGKVLGLLPK